MQKKMRKLKRIMSSEFVVKNNAIDKIIENNQVYLAKGLFEI